MKQEILIAHVLKHMKTIDKTTNHYLYEIRAYNSLIKKIKSLPSIIKLADIMDMNITEHMKNRLLEFIRSKEPVEFEYTLQTFTGIGSKLAKQLVDSGVDSISKLKSKKVFTTLPLATQIDIIYNPLKRIPRHIISHVEKLTKSVRIPFTYVGSYRRDALSSSDIDVLIKAKVPEDFIMVLNKKMGGKVKFHEPYASGKSKISTIVYIPKYSINVKMDIFITSPEEFPFALLYSTGSKQFNINFRAKCKSMGYLLNQKGLFDKKGNLISCKTEKDIFEYIGVNYIEPYKR